MEEDAYAFENCQQIRTKPFSRPIKRNWPECGREVTLVEHAHDEPVYIGFNREKYFKGCKNAYFKYGGTGIEFSEGPVQGRIAAPHSRGVRGPRDRSL